jgi:hypothetical protein
MHTRLISLTALAFAMLPAAAMATGTDAPANDTSDQGGIVVSGRLAHTAREEQKAAPNLINVQAAEAIAKYPDVNAAEALSRMPGVALSIDTGEGRFINIRGLDGNFNGSTMGGVVLLNTQPGGTYFNAAGRAVEFDTVPIGAVDRMSIIKTGLPDHDAEGIGGSVELTPRTAIGANRLFADVTLGGGVETLPARGFIATRWCSADRSAGRTRRCPSCSASSSTMIIAASTIWKLAMSMPQVHPTRLSPRWNCASMIIIASASAIRARWISCPRKVSAITCAPAWLDTMSTPIATAWSSISTATPLPAATR